MIKVEIKDDLIDIDMDGSNGVVLSEILAAIVVYLKIGDEEEKVEMIKAILEELLKYDTTKEQIEAILNINKYISEVSDK